MQVGPRFPNSQFSSSHDRIRRELFSSVAHQSPLTLLFIPKSQRGRVSLLPSEISKSSNLDRWNLWLRQGQGRLGISGCFQFRSWHQLSCLHAVLNPNVHGLKITQLLCENSSLIRLGGVENTCYIQGNNMKSRSWSWEFAMEFWNQQVGRNIVWGDRIQDIDFRQVKAKCTTFRRKSNCPWCRSSCCSSWTPYYYLY